MKLTTPLKIFLSVALLAGGAQAASLSLGGGGLATAHAGGTLTYTDPSGIVIHYTKAPQAGFTSGSNSRGWSNDPAADVLGFQEINPPVPDHLSVAHFGAGDQVNLDFSSAGLVDLSTVVLRVYDLDTNGVAPDTFTEVLNVEDGAGNNPINGNAGALNGESVTYAMTLGGGTTSAILRANTNPFGSSGLSAFTVEWTPIPEPSSGLLALFGASVFFLRRRR